MTDPLEAIMERAITAGLAERKRLTETSTLLAFASRSPSQIQTDIIRAAVSEALRGMDELLRQTVRQQADDLLNALRSSILAKRPDLADALDLLDRALAERRAARDAGLRYVGEDES
jgi:hypothetical protein